MDSKKLTYSQSGVNIDEADQAKRAMAKSLEPRDARVLNRHGAFASLFQANFPGLEDPVLVLKSEEPGSKQLLAFQHGFVRSICFDLINHLINDIAVMGAKPLAVLDTIVCSKLQKETIVQIVEGLSQACREQDCNLVGGETSEQPGVLSDGRYVLCATVVGVVDRRSIIDGAGIKSGDVVLALASNGPHTNGYTLIRRLIADDEKRLGLNVAGASFLEAIMKPHSAYYPFLKEILGRLPVHGLAHITGGGIEGNLNRILPAGLAAQIALDKIKIPPIFSMIRELGNVPDADMLRTFNLGVGITLVAPKIAAADICNTLSKHGLQTYPIGTIIESPQAIQFSGKLDW